jgi:integrase
VPTAKVGDLATVHHAELVAGNGLAEDAAEWLFQVLGTVAPRDPKTRRLGPRKHRIEWLAELCERETFLLVMSWLGSDAVPALESKRHYADDIRLWAGVARELGGHERFFLGCISMEMIETWTKAQKAKNASPRTINRRLSALTSFTRYAAWKLKDDRLVSPVTKYDRPKVDPFDETTATPLLEVHEYRRVIKAAKTAREAVVPALIYTVAGRVSECCTATISQRRIVDGKWYLALTRKRSKRRLWPIPDRLRDLFLVALDGRTEGHLLVDGDSKPMDRHAIDRLLTRLGKEAGVLPGRDVTPHVLRKARLTHMHDEGVDLEEIQDYADHARIETTLRYVQMRNMEARRAKHAESAVDVYADLVEQFTV